MSRSPVLRRTLWLGLLLPLWVGATEMYRYTNAQGVMVIDRQGVPSEFIAKGYEVLNDQGRVVRVVPPAPTPEELQKLLADRERAKSDAQLLRLYSSPEDVDRARARKLADFREAVKPYADNKDVQQIIRQYVRTKRKGEKIKVFG